MLVVSDDPLARTGLALLLKGQEGLTVAGQVGVDDDWPEPGLEGGLDAAVWDLGLGARFGLERLRGMGPSAPPAVAVVADEIDAREALAAGARAALPRDTDGESLAAAIRAVVQGLVVLDESFAAALLAIFATLPPLPRISSRISPRGKPRCSSSSPRGSPTRRSPSGSASATTRSSSTSTPSSASSASRAAARRSCRPCGWGW